VRSIRFVGVVTSMLLVATGCASVATTLPTVTHAATIQPASPSAGLTATDAARPTSIPTDPSATPTPPASLPAGVTLTSITIVCEMAPDSAAAGTPAALSRPATGSAAGEMAPRAASTVGGRAPLSTSPGGEDACQQAATAILARLGAAAVDVTRIHVSYTRMAACSCGALVGSRDGSLEAFSFDWSDLSVGDGSPADASAWPWGDAAQFTSPPAARGTFDLQAPAAVATRSPLPYCGDDTPADLTHADHAACFIDSVLAGRPAEWISEGPGYEGGRFVSIQRFMGSGAITIDSGSHYVHDGATKPELSWAPRTYGMLEIYPDGTCSVNEIR
jgi:hypothetical protein